MSEQEGSAGGVVKISVLASGRILLGTREVSLEELGSALDIAKLEGATVQYYRENSEGPAPAEAEAVIRLVTDRRLRIGLTTDQEKPPAKILEFPSVETFFAKVRRLSAGNRGVSLVRPNQTHYILPIPAPGAISEPLVDGVKSVVNSEQPRNIAAISAADALSGDPTKKPTLPDIARHVPFFGLLVGLAYAGHAVWLFDAVPSLMPAGCEEADVLVVDSNAVATLPSGWVEDAKLVMRNPNILVYDRARQKVGALVTAGEVPGAIEFPN